MEKYYLKRLADLAADTPKLRRASKLVEVNFARRPQSFGIVYLARDRLGRSRKFRLILSTFEPSNDNNAAFKTLASLELPEAPLDFDAAESIFIDKPSPNLVVLQEDGSLLVASLADGQASKLLRASREQSLQCKLQQVAGDSEAPSFDSHVHLLTETGYAKYKLPAEKVQSPQPPPATDHSTTQSRLVLESNYSLPATEFLKFRRFSLVGATAAILELSDDSFQLVRDSTCLAKLNLEPKSEALLVLSSPGSDQEAILLATTRNSAKISASYLSLAEPAKSSPKEFAFSMDDELADPDRLLPRKPSFEFEHCWSIDLNDIDNIRSLSEQDEDQEGELDDDSADVQCVPMWAPNQPKLSWPKFLIVSFKCHLLVYCFEHEPEMPFSVVYDKSFLDLAEQTDNSRSNKTNQAFLDVQSEPKLVQNFKLIGSQFADSLFNTLFLTARSKLIRSHYFGQLKILLSLSQLGDLFAFKFTSPKIVGQKDNVYQQLLLDSIKTGSLLKINIQELNEGNAQIREDITALEEKVRDDSDDDKPTGSTAGLEKLLGAELKQTDSPGCLYNLNLTVSSPVAVIKIVLLSTVSCQFMEPARRAAFEFIQIENSYYDKAVEIPLEKQSSSGQQRDDETLKAWVVLELSQEARIGLINVPVSIADGQSGIIEVFFIISPSNRDHFKGRLSNFNVEHLQMMDEQVSKFHHKRLPVRPLMSYQPLRNESPSLISTKNSNELLISGFYHKTTIQSWLAECLCPSRASQEPLESGSLISTFTQCLIHYKLAESQLLLTSDDFVALEWVKKHYLKRATDASMKLEIKTSVPKTENLHHLIRQQVIKLNLFQRYNLQNDQIATGGAKKSELLIDNLLGEFDMFVPPEEEFDRKNLEESLKRDVEQLLLRGDTSQPSEEPQWSEEIKTHFDLAGCFILQAISEFDMKLKGVEPTVETLRVMRARVDKILSSTCKANSEATQIVDEILSAWNGKLVSDK